MSNMKMYKHIFLDRKFFFLFWLAIISGMPFSVLFTALSTWMTEAGVALASIGLFAAAKTPYAFKYWWSPLVDNVRLPILHKLLGRRRSWMVFINLLLVSTIFMIGKTNPVEDIWGTFYLAFAFCVCAATFDIAWDAFRIESLPEDMQALGSAIAVSGYRVGMLVSGAGSMYLATYYGWENTFAILALLFSTGTLVALLMSEPDISLGSDTRILSWKMIKKSVLEPFLEFFSRNDAILILSILVLYKTGEAFLGVMLNPFYIKLGFTKIEIASVVKVYGLAATFFGVYLGGFLMIKYSNLRTLLICGVGQMLSNLIFVWQNYMGADLTALTISITIENITGGMGTAALVGYMSNLCNKKYTGTHYAFLSAFAAFMTSTFASSSGKLAEMMGWDMFFIFTAVISLPALLLIRFLTVN